MFYKALVLAILTWVALQRDCFFEFYGSLIFGMKLRTLKRLFYKLISNQLPLIVAVKCLSKLLHPLLQLALPRAPACLEHYPQPAKWPCLGHHQEQLIVLAGAM